ncbi:hypothetical protein Tco_0991816 [Tanacetum coccineum]|uniref:Reverse transcriptase domain-containing protein n=1 Tax=Tanacetum coccineum TaxID=301880 RepID=A0ABQ5F0N5_9ASTR
MWSKLTPLGLVKEKSMLELYRCATSANFTTMARALRSTLWQTGEAKPQVHNTFYVSNFKKCYADEPLAVPLDGLHFDDKLQLVEEPVEIMDREVRRLRKSRVQIVKVRWNSKRM